MNPNATLTLILDAIKANKLAAASEHADTLQAWISNGGLRPTNVPDGINLDALLAAATNIDPQTGRNYPGKFEGEPIETAYFYHSSDDGSVFDGPFNPEPTERALFSLEYPCYRLTESDQGFVTILAGTDDELTDEDEDEDDEPEDDPRLASLVARGFNESSIDDDGRTITIRCGQCEALAINGVACHESGCSNARHECRGCNALIPVRQKYCADCS